MARKRNRFKSYRYVLQVTRVGDEALNTDYPFQPWIGPKGAPVWQLESPDEQCAFEALTQAQAMSALFPVTTEERIWTFYTVRIDEQGNTILRYPFVIKTAYSLTHYHGQLKRWRSHNNVEPIEKSMQRVLRGRTAGMDPDDLDFRQLLNDAKRRAVTNEGALRSELAHYKMRYEVVSRLLKDSQQRETANKSAANSYIESVETKILEVMRAAEKPSGETWPEAKPLFAMGWDYRSAPISLDMLMNTVTAFGTDGKKAVKDFLALYAVRSNQLGAGKPRDTKLVLYAFNPLTRPAHGQLYIYQHDAPELNHIATLD